MQQFQKLMRQKGIFEDVSLWSVTSLMLAVFNVKSMKKVVLFSMLESFQSVALARIGLTLPFQWARLRTSGSRSW